MAAAPPMVPPVPPLPGTLRRVFNWIRNALALIGLASLVYIACFDITQVVSDSMAPTLKGDGAPGSDWVLSEKISLRFRTPRRWEVVQFDTQDHLRVAKRVVGLPGETVSLVDKRPVINGAPLPIPASLGFLQYYAFGNLQGGQQTTCGSGYFVFGDDSRDSQDSRFEGPISADQIRARPWLIVWPPSRIGWVNP